jgi:putative phosphoesterase
MKLGVISDTHLRQAEAEMKDLLRGPFCGVEKILHAGDIIELPVLDIFREKEVLAVCGNMDAPLVRRQLPQKRMIQAGKFQIGLIHGWGGPEGIEERIQGEFAGVQCIIHGHTHFASQIQREGILFFNPGAFGGMGGFGRKSVGLLEVGDKITAEIVYL